MFTSMMGLEARTLSSTLASPEEQLTVAKYRIAYLAETVLPAPDSPLTMMDWFLWSLREKMRWHGSDNTPKQRQLRRKIKFYWLYSVKRNIFGGYKPGHLFKRFLCHCKYMGVHITHVLPMVGIDDVSFIDRQALIRIDGYQDYSLMPQGEKLSTLSP